MPYASMRSLLTDFSAARPTHSNRIVADTIACDWEEFRSQLMFQWGRLTIDDLNMAGPHRYRIAQIIAHKYGVAADMIENYLRNFERTMPLAPNMH